MEDEPTQRALKEKQWDLDTALNHFVGSIHEPIREAGKIPVVWQELVRELIHTALSSQCSCCRHSTMVR